MQTRSPTANWSRQDASHDQEDAIRHALYKEKRPTLFMDQAALNQKE